MKFLSQNWFFENRVDFEYKKYILLAYLQEVKGNFRELKLYPYLSDLIGHYNNLHSFSRNKKVISMGFPKKMKKADFEKFKLTFEQVVTDDSLMKEIEEIVGYSLPVIKYHLEEGRELYEGIETSLKFEPVGIIPLYKDEGYLFIKDGPGEDVDVYEYQSTIFRGADENFRGITTRYLESYRQSLLFTYEYIKKEVVKTNKKLPNPATYLVESGKKYPMKETLVPIASRLLVRYISKNG